MKLERLKEILDYVDSLEKVEKKILEETGAPYHFVDSSTFVDCIENEIKKILYEDFMGK